jgi:hypothetical protein
MSIYAYEEISFTKRRKWKTNKGLAHPPVKHKKFSENIFLYIFWPTFREEFIIKKFMAQHTILETLASLLNLGSS